MKTNKAFVGLYRGVKVVDTWYGPGKVVKRTARRLHVKLASEPEVWEYDAEHVEAFVRKVK